jgi:hypothetical protein
MLPEVHDVQEPGHLMAPDIALGWRETMTLSMGRGSGHRQTTCGTMTYGVWLSTSCLQPLPQVRR